MSTQVIRRATISSLCAVLLQSGTASAQCPATVTITSPNGGELLPPNTPVGIAYELEGTLWPSTTLYFHLLSGSGDYLQYLGYAFPPFAPTWTTPNCPASRSGYVVLVSGLDSCGNQISDTSDGSFAVQPLATTLTITAPNGGEVFGPSETVTLTCDVSDDYWGVVWFYISTDGGATWAWVGTDHFDHTAPYGAEWTTPPCLSSMSVLARASTFGCYGEVVSDDSDTPFSVDIPWASIAMTSLNGGELLASGTTAPITWTSSGPVSNSVSIEYSLNGGGTWLTIASNTPNDGVHPWVVSSVTQVTPIIVRINGTSTCGQAVSDQSNWPAFLVPGCDDGSNCTDDFFLPLLGQCQHIPFCIACGDELPPCPSWLECSEGGVCRPRTDICINNSPCKYKYPDPATGACRTINLCPPGFCCQSNLCQPCALLNPSLIGDISLSELNYDLNAVIDGAMAALFTTAGGFTTASPGLAYGQIELPTDTAFIAFEYQLLNPAPGGAASLSFADSLLWQTFDPTPTDEWVPEVVYLADVAGEVGQLKFALLPGEPDAPDDQFNFRNLRLYQQGTLIGDLDADDDIDLADYGVLVDCLTGPDAGGLPLGCDVFDLEGDDDLDLHDAAAFQTAFTGG